MQAEEAHLFGEAFEPVHPRIETVRVLYEGAKTLMPADQLALVEFSVCPFDSDAADANPFTQLPLGWQQRARRQLARDDHVFKLL